MIIGKLKDLYKYKGINPNLDIAIDFILSSNWRDTKLGKNIIYGKDVYMNRFNYKTINLEDGFFEGHKLYADIHLLVKGNELLFYADESELQPNSKYDEIDDFMKYRGNSDINYKMDEESFAICFPEDIHMSKIKLYADEVEKAVIKVRVKEK